MIIKVPQHILVINVHNFFNGFGKCAALICEQETEMQQREILHSKYTNLPHPFFCSFSAPTVLQFVFSFSTFIHVAMVMHVADTTVN